MRQGDSKIVFDSRDRRPCQRIEPEDFEETNGSIFKNIFLFLKSLHRSI